MNKSSILKSLFKQNCGADWEKFKTPCYLIDEQKLVANAKVLSSIIERTGCKVLLAQKAFSNYDFYPLLAPYLSGTEASGLYEARLGAEEMAGKEVHVFCAAYRDDEFAELLQYADHIVFNSIGQLKKFAKVAREWGKSIGLRINPECSTQVDQVIYDPCAPGSRLGVTRGVWDQEMTSEFFSMLEGLHFHTLCEQNSDALETTLKAVEERFGDILPHMQWLNMGGGHHITKKDYDIERLEKLINYAQDKWSLCIYLEPGEAVALNAGYLVSQVLDIVKNGNLEIAILDTSAACHMPDVIEMPYLPPLLNPKASQEEEGHWYRLAGPTCLAGDIIGQYCLVDQLQVGDYIVFGDMAIYTTCKNNTFNGMPLPNIYKIDLEGKLSCLTDFDYKDFKMRLGSYRNY